MPLPEVPNLVLPLATSYNERGVAGFTHTVTNSEDQRKVNCFYEVAKNPITGKGTLTLSKRPGVTLDSETYGSSLQSSYLLSTPLGGSLLSNPIVFSTINGGADFTASIAGTTTTIATATGGKIPCFVDKTRISNVENIVVQIRSASDLFAHRAFYSSDLGNLVWSEITDPEFTGIVHRGKIEHLDGYALVLGSKNLIWNSDSNSLALWSSNGFLAKQIEQDYAQGLARLKNQIIAFGAETAEVFINAGNSVGSPLGRVPHLQAKVGLVTTHLGSGVSYYARIMDRIYFIGREAGGHFSIGVFAYDGARFEKVSSKYIDKILLENTSNFYSVNSFGFHGQSALSIGLSAPGDSVQRWLMFFPEWKEWFEWTSTIFSPTNSGQWFLGSSFGNRNRVYSFGASDKWQDDTTLYPWLTQFKLPTNGASRKVLNMYGVDADTDTTTNDLTVEISKDDSKTFSTLGTIDQTRERKILFRGGAIRKAHVRLGNTNARPTRIHNFLANVS